jgi:hypothetical protein
MWPLSYEGASKAPPKQLTVAVTQVTDRQNALIADVLYVFCDVYREIPRPPGPGCPPVPARGQRSSSPRCHRAVHRAGQRPPMAPDWPHDPTRLRTADLATAVPSVTQVGANRRQGSGSGPRTPPLIIRAAKPGRKPLLGQRPATTNQSPPGSVAVSAHQPDTPRHQPGAPHHQPDTPHHQPGVAHQRSEVRHATSRPPVHRLRGLGLHLGRVGRVAQHPTQLVLRSLARTAGATTGRPNRAHPPRAQAGPRGWMRFGPWDGCAELGSGWRWWGVVWRALLWHSCGLRKMSGASLRLSGPRRGRAAGYDIGVS